MESKELIAVDLGKKHTGLARSSTISKIASPLMTLATDDLVAELQKIIRKNQVEAIILGLPRNLEGKDTEQTLWVREYAKTLKQQINRPLYFVDEALTTGQGGGKDDHQTAATAILQDFLLTPETERITV